MSECFEKLSVTWRLKFDKYSMTVAKICLCLRFLHATLHKVFILRFLVCFLNVGKASM